MLTCIDELLRDQYYYLTATDECYCLREYTAGHGYAHSDTNSLIANLKKGVDRRGRPEWEYKERAIRQVAAELAESLPRSWLAETTLIPMPPSKARADPLYDDRMHRVLLALPGSEELDVRELIEQRVSTDAAHLSEQRPRLEEIKANYLLREELREPVPDSIALFDDIVTTGAHFKAAKWLLTERFPGVTVVGIFVARVIRLDEDPDLL